MDFLVGKDRRVQAVLPGERVAHTRDAVGKNVQHVFGDGAAGRQARVVGARRLDVALRPGEHLAADLGVAAGRRVGRLLADEDGRPLIGSRHGAHQAGKAHAEDDDVVFRGPLDRVGKRTGGFIGKCRTNGGRAKRRGSRCDSDEPATRHSGIDHGVPPC